MKKRYTDLLASAVLLALAVLISGCATPGPGPANTNGAATTGQKTSLEVAPAKDEGGWKVVEAGSVTFTVTAPKAESVKLLYRPTIADESQYVRLREIKAPADAASGKFTSEMKLPEDFAGEVWAEVAYPDGRKETSDEVAVRTSTAPVPGENGGDAATGSASKADPGLSARSDAVTGGKIEKGELVAGDPNLRITINIPAFQLTLWQSGKEIKTYPIGIGREKFPLPKGNRVAREVVFNPDWIPPDSEWVDDMKGVEPGETYEADDPKNPLGKVKIPLGDGILIHMAHRKSELGGLVSHGCARMVEPDIFDLAKKIVDAQGLSVTDEQIEELRKNKERKNVGLKQPIPVDISYDTAVVEGGTLHLYPDVYDEKTATVANVREKLEASKVDVSKLDDKTIEQMLAKVDKKSAFVVPVSDLASGRAVASGKTVPVVATAGSEKSGKSSGESSGDKASEKSNEPKSSKSRGR